VLKVDGLEIFVQIKKKKKGESYQSRRSKRQKAVVARMTLTTRGFCFLFLYKDTPKARLGRESH
jgi:hypothetical protein